VPLPSLRDVGRLYEGLGEEEGQLMKEGLSRRIPKNQQVRGEGVLLVFVIHDRLALYPFIKPTEPSTSLTTPFASCSGANA
jgi:hypothetical protein